MFTISTKFKKYLGKRDERGGVVRITIMSNRHDNADLRVKREINLDIHGADKSVIAEHKEEIAKKIRLLYCIIEHRADSGKDCSIDDIVKDFREALSGNADFVEARAKADTLSPLRADLVSIGREFRGCFQYVYPTKKVNPDSLSDYIDAQILTLKNEKKESRIRSYESTHARLKEFTGKENVPFSIIDRAFIKDFADWLKTSGITESTQSFYLRTLRSILNHAREDGLMSGCENWFTNVDTRIIFDKTADNMALPLRRNTLKEIRELDLSNDPETALTRDMFMFGFYCRGMELVDVAYLTSENIRGGVLEYSRRKAGKKISMPLDPEASRIIGQYTASGRKYLFPFLYDDDRFSFDSMRNRLHKSIKKLGKAVGFNNLTFSMNITAYKNFLSQCPVSNLL